MKYLILVCSAFLFICSGCESRYDGMFPESKPIPIINGVLYADSVLSLNLTWSNDPQEKEFKPISEVSFVLKKNGFLISAPYMYKNDGTYLFKDTCKSDNKYEVEVQIAGYPKITSQTTIPTKPTVRFIKTNQYPSEIFDLEVTNIDKKINAIYIFLFLAETDEKNNIKWKQSSIYGDSPFIDPFNRFYDSWAPKGFLYEYESFVRFPADNLTNGRLHTRLAFIGQSEHIRFHLIAAPKEYDLYYKGGYLQRSFNPEVNLPFTYQPIFLPTNISGGAGIFSGIDLSIFEFEGKIYHAN